MKKITKTGRKTATFLNEENATEGRPVLLWCHSRFSAMVFHRIVAKYIGFGVTSTNL